MTVLDPESSPVEEGSAPVDIVGALAYTKAFIVDVEPFSAMDRVRP